MFFPFILSYILQGCSPLYLCSYSYFYSSIKLNKLTGAERSDLQVDFADKRRRIKQIKVLSLAGISPGCKKGRELGDI